MEKERTLYRYFLYWLLCLSAFSMVAFFHFGIRRQIPSEYFIKEGKETQIDFAIPVCVQIDNGEKSPVKRELCFQAGKNPYYIVKVSAFGVLPIREIALKTTESTQVYASGKPIGIYAKTKGVMVIDTGSFQSGLSQEVHPAEGILQSGDYILKVNEIPVSRKKQVIGIIEESKGKQCIFTILRKGEVSNVCCEPKKNEEGIYKAGIWVRDSAEGIGTMTFVTKEGRFAALGHSINDSDTGKKMELERGSIYATDILSIHPAKAHEPGQIMGVLTLDDRDYMGKVLRNEEIGIYGQLTKKEYEKVKQTESLYEVAYKQDVKKGKAQILSDVTGEEACYDIEIQDLYFTGKHKNQGILLKVTDERLIAYTGGIVQGMSGSPILQDGKIIGAVTHVFVNDPTRGYGIFIDEMMGENDGD